MRPLGRHLVIDLYGCDSKLLASVGKVQDIVIAAAKATRATILDVVSRAFKPQGVSSIVVIAESHLAIHTWPEHRFASVDIYTCGGTVDPWKAGPILKKRFKAKKITTLELKRGILT